MHSPFALIEQPEAVASAVGSEDFGEKLAMAQVPTSYSKTPIPVIGLGFSANQVLGVILLLLVAMEHGQSVVSDQTFQRRVSV
jgi:hypothetical protein